MRETLKLSLTGVQRDWIGADLQCFCCDWQISKCLRNFSIECYTFTSSGLLVGSLLKNPWPPPFGLNGISKHELQIVMAWPTLNTRCAANYVKLSIFTWKHLYSKQLNVRVIENWYNSFFFGSHLTSPGNGVADFIPSWINGILTWKAWLALLMSQGTSSVLGKGAYQVIC